MIDWKKLKKIMLQLLLMFRMLKKKKYILLIFQNITPIAKSKLPHSKKNYQY